MKRVFWITLLLGALMLAFAGCGGSEEKAGVTEETPTKAVEQTPKENRGVDVAKEILAAYDQAVAEVAALVKDLPEVAEVKPKIEAVIQKYADQMKALNTRYLALKDEDIALFGSANGYLGENRGKHVYEQNQALYAAREHYRKNSEDTEIDHLLHWGLIHLLDQAVER